MDELYGGNLSVLGVLSEVCWVSDDSDVSLLILVVFTIESDDVFLCLAVIMPQITKMIITQYMNIMRICLLEKRDILIPRIMLSINISLYILKNYCFFHYLAEELLSVADVSLTRPSGWSETFNSLVLSS